MARVIDGEAIAADIRREVAAEVAALSSSAHGIVPGLAVVLVGSWKDSRTYADMKCSACADAGIRSVLVDLPEDTSEAALVAEVRRLNADPAVHGIFVQLPLPKHINDEKILNEIHVEKDVEGFHPLNIGKLAMKGREPLFIPCIAKACMELLSRGGVTVRGKLAAVVGRSNIIGLPVSLLLLKADATVSIVHSGTPEPRSIVRQADIVIAASGKPMMIKGDWIKPGAAVIDVGHIVAAAAEQDVMINDNGDLIKPGAAVVDVGHIVTAGAADAVMINGNGDLIKTAAAVIHDAETNSVDDPAQPVGDVDFAEVSKVAGFLTPVPGGAGPMMVAMLLKNTVHAAKQGRGICKDAK